MKIDGALVTQRLADVPAAARRMEADGYDGVFTFEGPHDPFLPLMLAAEHSERLELTTAIAVAFARSPMTIAATANDLQAVSNGRFVLGLGTQIKPHIEKRFSMPWSHPAPRLRELALAIRAIWATWNDGVPLDFRGEFYRHTLMTPFFDPGPNPFGPPRIVLAGVGPLMTEVAGEVGDGFIVHPFSTAHYLQHDDAARARARLRDRRSRPRRLRDLVPGDDRHRRHRPRSSTTARFAVTAQLAFYGSTPAYRPVLDAHGWGDLQPSCSCCRGGASGPTMAALMPDELVDRVHGERRARGDRAAGRSRATATSSIASLSTRRIPPRPSSGPASSPASVRPEPSVLVVLQLCRMRTDAVPADGARGL